MQRGDPNALAKLERDAGHEVEPDERGGRVRPEEPQREEEEDSRDPQPAYEAARDEALDQEGNERRARVDGCVELAEEVLARDAAPDGGLIEAKEVEEVRELHEEIPKEHADAERAQHAVGRDGAVTIDGLAKIGAKTLRPVLVLDRPGAMPLRQASVGDQRDEAHEEADRLRADEVLGVHDRRDARPDEASKDLPDEDRAREEGKESLRLLRAVEIAGVDPEEDVDRLLDAVREHVGDRLDHVADDRIPDRELDPDRQQRRARDVPEQHRAPAHAIHEEEDERRDGEHRDGRDDVHPRHVLNAVALDEQGVRAELADPIGADHEGQQDVQEDGETALAAAQRNSVTQEPSEHGAKPSPRCGRRQGA